MMTETTAIIICITGISALVAFYQTMKKLISEPVDKVAHDLQAQHEDFSVAITKQGDRIDRTLESIDRQQTEMKDLNRRVYENTTRIIVLEQKVNGEDER